VSQAVISPAVAGTMDVLGRSPGANAPESGYEKLMVLPKLGDDDVAKHAWADARFGADILTEHALFFALLMPEELSAKERAEALRFGDEFQAIYD
jgi:hypothetical protein